ncbi:increased DNA methylation 1-like isoform X2 [Cynara cardunculus var. scolymus]|nr:increased DNA methylation 1-like isoform X2 [Cynara cardunculus var. scolymus]XP_024985516.1 increased DNA methylation 1-like isoform X2 [Cynara cardunculus var. scolymus]
MEGNSYEEQSQRKAIMKSLRSVPKSRKSAADFNLSLHKIKGKIRRKRSSKSASAQESTNGETKPRSRPTLKDQQMNRLIFREGGLPDGSKVAYINHGERLLEGYKLGRGIFCYCCNTEVSPSQFEAHAGQASRKKPYGNIFVSSGVSLHEYASSLKLNCERLAKQNDDICRHCSEGEDLMLCAGCPRSYHEACLHEKSTTPGKVFTGKWFRGKWFCPCCQKSMKPVDQRANSLAAGRISGVDPIEQITKRCIRIVDNPDKFDLVACSLCRSYDFSQDGFNDRTVIVCDQCEKEFHIGCLREHKIDDLKELPVGNWFCCVDCDRIHSVLKDLRTCGPERVPDFLMDIVRNKWKESDANGFIFDMEWIVLCGKDALHEHQLLLSEAVDIFHECFDPIIDSTTGSDFIPSMAYGMKMGDSDFSGVHCAMLMRGSSVITAGMFRIFGQDVAELPIVATSKPEQGKGFFQLFFTCFERMLSYLNIKKIVIPAAEDAKSLWTNRLGFIKVIPKELSEYRQTLTSMVAFRGTSMLEKEVPEGEITFEDGVRFSLSMG